MKESEALDILVRTGAVIRGHFLLTSGMHSDTYIQCAQVLRYPKYTAQLIEVIAKAFAGDEIDLVAGPAVGGIIVSYETGRQLGVPALFTERENGKMTLRRGFEIPAGARVLVVEDVVTTGGSVKEVIDVVKGSDAIVAGVGLLVDRSEGRADFGVKKQAVLNLKTNIYSPGGNCPMCKEGSPLIKPGSRGLR